MAIRRAEVDAVRRAELAGSQHLDLRGVMSGHAARPANATEELAAALVGSVGRHRCTSRAESDGDGRPCDARAAARRLGGEHGTGQHRVRSPHCNDAACKILEHVVVTAPQRSLILIPESA